MQKYKNTDGTYTSPKNGKIYKTEKAIRAHMSYKGHVNPGDFAKRLYNVKCVHCDDDLSCSNIKRHESACYLNPANMKLCIICSNPIKDYKNSKGTCSHSCSNKHFRTGEDNGNYRDSISSYAILCYRHHEKKCIVCGETFAVDVHHIDSNRENNSVDNLIPLCPTHHAYCHRGLYHMIEDKISRYLIEYKKNSVW